jgi:UDP-N-acetylglucosamine--N-acetylmuramyl-(pentapeptide) pyrophosphoryl-undecaprenol N-acetylglucosamine transferase
MPELLRRCELVICRAGASTLAELACAGKPAIIVPSPYVTDNHQEKNAEAAVRAGGAVMLRESDCGGGGLLYETALGILRDADRAAAMSRSWEKLRYGGAAEKIADIIQELAGDKSIGKEARQ